MRMPPYMRDSDQNSLSITYRQYHALMDLIDRIAAAPPKTALKAAKVRAAAPAAAPGDLTPEDVRKQRIAARARLKREGPITRRVDDFTKRRDER